MGRGRGGTPRCLARLKAGVGTWRGGNREAFSEALSGGAAHAAVSRGFRRVGRRHSAPRWGAWGPEVRDGAGPAKVNLGSCAEAARDRGTEGGRRPLESRQASLAPGAIPRESARTRGPLVAQRPPGRPTLRFQLADPGIAASHAPCPTPGCARLDPPVPTWRVSTHSQPDAEPARGGSRGVCAQLRVFYLFLWPGHHGESKETSTRKLQLE